MYGIPRKHFVSGEYELTRPLNHNNELSPRQATSNVASFVVAAGGSISDACLQNDARAPGGTV